MFLHSRNGPDDRCGGVGFVSSQSEAERLSVHPEARQIKLGIRSSIVTISSIPYFTLHDSMRVPCTRKPNKMTIAII
jgi:hypothetical protein